MHFIQGKKYLEIYKCMPLVREKNVSNLKDLCDLKDNGIQPCT